MGGDNFMCDHVWRRVNEEFLLGGYFPVGWRCEICNRFVSINKMEPGISGTISNKEELVGIHGDYINTASGKKCRKQIIDKTTHEIEYIE
jgi:hypothetical protein